MRHCLPIVLITSVASIFTSSLFAETKIDGKVDKRLAQDRPFARDYDSAPRLGGRLAQLSQERKESIPSAEYLIFQRAHKRAEERAALLEARRWSGYTPNRPTIPYTQYATDLNPGLYKPWVSVYFGGRAGW